MTKVVVNSGACGFTVAVKAEKGSDKKVLVFLDTACEMVRKMQEDIAAVDRQRSTSSMSPVRYRRPS
jgi:4-hydroxy-3-methylbut-2-enyl diphosphate reductase IspH